MIQVPTGKRFLAAATMAVRDLRDVGAKGTQLSGIFSGGSFYRWAPQGLLNWVHDSEHQ